MKFPILLPNIFNHPFTYESDNKLEIGDFVEVPFGKTKITGVVWDNFEKKNTKSFKIKKIIKKLKIPKLRKKTINFLNWFADYNIVPKGMALKLVLLGGKSMNLGDIIATMQATYCGSVGVEYMHITQNKPRMWVREQVETQQVLQRKLKPEQQKSTLEALVAADGLEKYLAVKYAGQKRFALEGGDALIPLLRINHFHLAS